MVSADPEAEYSALRAADPELMDRDELAALVQTIARHAAWLDSLRVRVTRRQRALAADGQGEAPAELLARHGGQSGRDAHAADARERVCSAMPGFEAALAAGVVAPGHVDAIAHATRSLDAETQAEFSAHADSLLADAARQGIDAFERTCRDLARLVASTTSAASDAEELDRQRAAAHVKRWVDRQTGMCSTLVCLDPVRDRTLWTAINAARARLRQRDGNRGTPWAQLEVDAVVAAIGTDGGNGAGGELRVPEISVLIDLATLQHGRHSRSICEADDGTPLPVSTVRRLCCEAEIVPLVLGVRGEALDAGRGVRVANRGQRRALRAMRAMHRTCAHPECTAPFDACRIHHVVPWYLGGATDLANLLPVCEAHHHLVHEGGWRLELDAERIATWTRPDGRRHHRGPTIDRVPAAERAITVDERGRELVAMRC